MWKRRGIPRRGGTTLLFLILPQLPETPHSLPPPLHRDRALRPPPRARNYRRQAMENLQKFKYFYQENTSLPARWKKRAPDHSGGPQRVRFPEDLWGLRWEEIAIGAKFPSEWGPAPNKGGKVGGVYHQQKIKGQGKIQEVCGNFRQGAWEWLPQEASSQGKRHLPAGLMIHYPYHLKRTIQYRYTKPFIGA